MKLGIVGSGKIVTTLLEVIGSIPGYELHSLYSRNIEKGHPLCEKYSIANYYNDYDEMLESDVEIVYIGLPNHLHFDFAKKALLKGKNVIVEKSFTLNLEDAVVLKKIALERKLYLFEAITNIHLEPFKKIKEMTEKMGDIKIVSCNFSQYSSRYDQFKEGVILPAFDIAKGGGALFDLNVYNIHFVVGLFGRPENIFYYPNIREGVDTSGVLILDYPQFKAVCIGSKDTKAPISSTIQGDQGYVQIEGPVSQLNHSQFKLNGSEPIIVENHALHRMLPEFETFIRIISNSDYQEMVTLLDHTIDVVEVLERAKIHGNLSC